jgi:SulP family sulfate permease
LPGLRRYLPFLDWAPAYSRKGAENDVLAAAIVTIMLVPQSLAYAMLAGLPPHVGLYASILPLVAYAVFGTSRTLAVGPVAVVSLMTAAAAGQVAAQGTEAYIQAAIVLALLSGLIHVAMSALRLGFLANFLSHPVISGFISASGILIAASQAKHILGVSAGGDTLPEMLAELAPAFGRTNIHTLAVGLASLTFLLWARRRLKLLVKAGMKPRPADMIAKAGPVGVIAAAVGAVLAFGLDAKGVKIVVAIPSGLPPFAVPSFDAALWWQLLPAAGLISLVGFVESVSVAQTLAAKRRQRILPDRELTGLGAANIASALSGGYPVTGGFARSVVNFDAGAETPMAGMFTAAGILGAALLLTPLFRYLPQAVLAATIIVAVLSLVDFAAMKRTFAYSKADFAAMAVTMLVVLGVGVEAGILSGVGLSLALFLYRTQQAACRDRRSGAGHGAFPQLETPCGPDATRAALYPRRRKPLFRQCPLPGGHDLRRRGNATRAEARRADVSRSEPHRRLGTGKPGGHRPSAGRGGGRLPSFRGQGTGDGCAETLRLLHPLQG